MRDTGSALEGPALRNNISTLTRVDACSCSFASSVCSKVGCDKPALQEEQLVKILREADQAPVSEVAKKHGASDVRIYASRKRFGKLG